VRALKAAKLLAADTGHQPQTALQKENRADDITEQSSAQPGTPPGGVPQPVQGTKG